MKNRKLLSLFLALVMILSSLSIGVFADSYLVKKGDVLWKIAEQYGTDYKTLAEYNNIKDPNMIYEGTTLQIPETSKKITLLGTADLHGRIYAYEYAIDSVDADAGLAKIQTIVKRERELNPDAILMDVGDTIQDNSAELFNDLPVHPMVQVMNEMDFDIWAIGNHEFNFEKSLLDRNIAAFEGTAISANIYKTGTNERFIDGYKILNVDGVRVAIVGMIPPYVPVWEASSPSHFSGLEFKSIADETAKVVAELEGKYDVLVGAYHLGPDDDHGFEGLNAIAEAFPQFDVMFGGHAHSRYVTEVNGVTLIEPGAYGWALAKADIEVVPTADGYEVKQVVAQNIETYKEVEDQGILDKFAFVHEQSVADANTVVGKVTADYIEDVDYITGDAVVTTMPTAQIIDTPLIDLINDVQMFYTKAQISSAAAFKNDMNLVAGDFKKKDVANIYKYANTLVGVNITGANLKGYMEWSASYYNTYTPGDVTVSFDQNIRGYNYDMFSGVTYDIDISKPAGSRITNLMLDGKAISDTMVYKLAVNNYRFGTLLSNGWVVDADKYYDSYETMQDAGRIRDLIIKYIGEEKAGVATPSVDNNWKIIGADLEHALKSQVIDMLKAGTISIPRSEDGRTPNVKSLNIIDLLKDGTISSTDYKNLTLLHTNDMHGFFIEGKYDGMGAAKMATFIKGMKADSANTLLLDAGDALQGHNLVTLSDGEEGTKVLNALGYDAMTLGNHEFDYGSAQTVKLGGMLNFPMLAANVKKTDGSLLVDDYKIFSVDGIKVGVFGLGTPETVYKSHPDNTAGITFEDIYTTATAMVTTLKAEGAQVIVTLAHIGDEGEFTTGMLAEKVAGIDVIIDGHSHSTYPDGKLVGTTLIVAAGEKTKNVGVVELTVKSGMVDAKKATLFTKSASAALTDDAAMTAIVADIQAKNDVITEEVVATSPVLLVGEKQFVRTSETNLGNLLTEALLDISKADVAFTNGGGIRSSIDVGPVTKGEVLTVLPYGNTVRVIELTGADIWAAIENGVDEYPSAKGAFPHIAGMTVKFDSTKAAGSRVTEIMVAGNAIDLTKTYTMATNDFLVAGGDGYSMFKGKKVVAEFGAMDEVLIDYMNAMGFDKAVEDNRIMDINDVVSFIFNFFAA
ncbi:MULTISPECIES: 5'-nucleotidase C-terminal domain-containing protein [unclassified Fusibacter]|uniref:5'-nucleotidase C-terminal domain-containing protein n=1 Tax=unclassified Fusibacter TaxID=2624464 RepID=UPI0010118180|nr:MULTISPECIES: 5'-nucleotidase C-terminal domain-containing protein [unclassified Fusibacter]MCK8060184.1 5'-nucleotidase C-terminal domain-containing protein [Fusibacter sp. A2]NPE22324.1 LysM peptidoglycan-binding domain-containing protein [Fusibacter sp. A1]RXV61097.1 LysM peptidoglycan-binding domain-containing protein [Fusibacter sp. A1]